MWGCWSYTYCFCWTFGALLKCNQSKLILKSLLLKIFIGSINFLKWVSIKRFTWIIFEMGRITTWRKQVHNFFPRYFLVFIETYTCIWSTIFPTFLSFSNTIYFLKHKILICVTLRIVYFYLQLKWPWSAAPTSIHYSLIPLKHCYSNQQLIFCSF